jgi:aspartyl-tRNA synthetase
MRLSGRGVTIVAPGWRMSRQIDEPPTWPKRSGEGPRSLSPLEDGTSTADRQVPRRGAGAGVSRACRSGDRRPRPIVADRHEVTATPGRPVELGGRLGLADPRVLAYCWVHRFPMYQWDAERGRWDATHNPFSGVVPEDEPLLVTATGDPYRPSPDDPAGRAHAMQYDVALNGWELGGGSVRIHRRELLERSFALQGYTLEQMHDLFGGMLEAFDYGAPPHGGIALGIDRWAMVFSDQTNIREVMAFPKTQSGADLMLEAPSVPDPAQFAELGLRFVGFDKTSGG